MTLESQPPAEDRSARKLPMYAHSTNREARFSWLEDADYHLMRTVMIVIFLLFGFSKWFEYDAKLLVPVISSGPLTAWLYPVLGIFVAAYVLGTNELIICALLTIGFWNKKIGVLGALGSAGTFFVTVSIIPFIPREWWGPPGFPTLTLDSGFLLKDIALLAVSIYLVKQDLRRSRIFVL